MTHYQLSAEDFRPLAATDTAEQISRPSLSYWQDAWRRLKQNPRAVFSLWIVIALIFFTVF